MTTSPRSPSRLLRRLLPVRRARVERFGAIVELRRPQALVFINRAYARALGLTPRPGSDYWRGANALGDAPLSAPLEAHLQITDRCQAGCQGCYTASTPAGSADAWPAPRWKSALDALAEMGVFHVALGGGESASLDWLGEVASHARARGLVPNLTTSGLAGVDSLLAIVDLFGQINVSIDGLRSGYAAVRGFAGFAAADDALRRLRAKKREIGINVVVTRHNFAELDDIFAYARKRRLNEIELLRFKPAGRGVARFDALRCTDGQHRLFLPTVLAASRRHRVRARVDCSYVPMIAFHRPAPRLLANLAVYGCAGADHLVAASANGAATACSFAAAPPERPAIDELGDYWNDAHAFAAFRDWRDRPEPCQSCAYLSLCRGGCRAVADHLGGDERGADPECPLVVDWRAPNPTYHS